MLLLNNHGKNHNSEKSIESCSTIVNPIASQLLENIISDQIKIVHAKEYFNLSEEEIMEVYKDEHLIEHTEEEFEKEMRNFHGFKDSYVVFTNKGKNQHDIIGIKDSTIHLEKKLLKEV